ncbi:DEAD/DEAH box helicase [Shewanella sp. 10N.286.51.B8]|uniref:DEAD/DEAH box helicase n=1 Tax=Shewanella sp. 10N.286.51.B8 TaxID=3229708 RepID=UPI003550F655
MFHPQQHSINNMLASSEGGVLLHMATGSGKTHTALEHIIKTIKSGKRAIYITPLRAQANELFKAWSKKLSAYKVGIYTGEYQDTKLPVAFHDAQLLIMTPERLDACTRFWRNHWSWLPEADLLVIDELHLLGDIHRGARLEGAISRYRRLNPFVRIIGLTATIGNSQQLAQWLKVDVFESNWRAIPLKWNQVTFKRAEDKINLLLNLVLDEKSQSLIFVQSRRRAEEVSLTLQQHNIAASHHHAGLCKEEREFVETDFRQNKISVLVCTPTLEMGVNLPAGHVFIFDAQQYDGFNYSSISTNSAWQRAGRAGRPGLDTKALVTIFTPEWKKDIDHILSAKFESIESKLTNDAPLAEQLIAEIASGYAKDQTQLIRNLRLYFNRSQQQEVKAERLISEMIDADMLIEFESEKRNQHMQLRATKLGKLASRHMLQPSSILLFKKVIDDYQQISIFDCFLVLCSTNDCEPIIPLDYELLEQLQSELANKQTLLLQEETKTLYNTLSISGKRLINAFSMACMLDEFCNGKSIEIIASSWGCYPFEISRVIDSCIRLVTAFKGCIPDEKSLIEASSKSLPLSLKINLISTMLQSGLGVNTASLTMIEGIGPKIALKMYENGIEDIEDLSTSEAEQLSEIPGFTVNRSKRWINAAEQLLEQGYVTQLEQWQPTANIEKESSYLIDLYRLKRSLELKIKPSGEGRYRVTGGSEPHFLQTKNKKYLCDCMDFKKGNLCKHILAVKRYRKDPITLSEINDLQKKSDDSSLLSLKEIWISDMPKGAASWR